MRKGHKIWKKNGFALGTIAVVVLVLISLTYLSGNYLYSTHYSLDGSMSSSSVCESCFGGKSVYSSGQFTYGSNWGTWYVSQNTLFPISLKVNDMYNEQAIDDVYSKYRVVLRNKTTGAFIKDFSGNFENANYMESATIYYNFIVTGEYVVEAEVYLSRDGGLSWEESYYYLTGTRPKWTFKFQPTTVADIDMDGIPDDTDMCRTQPEVVNGYLDADGCPDTVPSGTAVVPSDGTITTIVPSNTPPPTNNSLPSGSDDPDDTSVDGDDTIAGDDDDEKPAPVHNYDIMEGSCADWANNTLFGLGKMFPSIVGPFAWILTVSCWLLRMGTIISFLPLIISANLHYAFAGILCLGSYEGILANAVPIIVALLFLLTCLVPDDLVSLVIGTTIAFFLGTTVPAGAIASVPIIAWLVGNATLPSFMGYGLSSSIQMGGAGIIVGLLILCIWNIFIDTSGVSSVIKNKDAGSNNVNITQNISVSNGGVKGARKFLAEVTLIMGVLMYAECQLGIPIYSAVWKIIMFLPELFTTLSRGLQGAGLI